MTTTGDSLYVWGETGSDDFAEIFRAPKFGEDVMAAEEQQEEGPPRVRCTAACGTIVVSATANGALRCTLRPPEEVLQALQEDIIAVGATSCHAVLATERFVACWSATEHCCVASPPWLMGRRVAQIACGAAFALALSTDHEVFGWGAWKGLRVKMASVLEVKRAVRVAGLVGIAVGHIAAGEGHAIAISTGGEAFAWGANQARQCGCRSARKFLRRPLPIRRCNLRDGERFATHGSSCGETVTLLVTTHGRILLAGGHHPPLEQQQQQQKPQVVRAKPKVVDGVSGVLLAAGGSAFSVLGLRGGKLLRLESDLTVKEIAQYDDASITSLCLAREVTPLLTTRSDKDAVVKKEQQPTLEELLEAGAVERMLLAIESPSTLAAAFLADDDEDDDKEQGDDGASSVVSDVGSDTQTESKAWSTSEEADSNDDDEEAKTTPLLGGGGSDNSARRRRQQQTAELVAVNLTPPSNSATTANNNNIADEANTASPPAHIMSGAALSSPSFSDSDDDNEDEDDGERFLMQMDEGDDDEEEDGEELGEEVRVAFSDVAQEDTWCADHDNFDERLEEGEEEEGGERYFEEDINIEAEEGGDEAGAYYDSSSDEDDEVRRDDAAAALAAASSTFDDVATPERQHQQQDEGGESSSSSMPGLCQASSSSASSEEAPTADEDSDDDSMPGLASCSTSSSSSSSETELPITEEQQRPRNNNAAEEEEGDDDSMPGLASDSTSSSSSGSSSSSEGERMSEVAVVSGAAAAQREAQRSARRDERRAEAAADDDDDDDSMPSLASASSSSSSEGDHELEFRRTRLAPQANDAPSRRRRRRRSDGELDDLPEMDETSSWRIRERRRRGSRQQQASAGCIHIQAMRRGGRRSRWKALKRLDASKLERFVQRLNEHPDQSIRRSVLVAVHEAVRRVDEAHNSLVDWPEDVARCVVCLWALATLGDSQPSTTCVLGLVEAHARPALEQMETMLRREAVLWRRSSLCRCLAFARGDTAPLRNRLRVATSLVVDAAVKAVGTARLLPCGESLDDATGPSSSTPRRRTAESEETSVLRQGLKASLGLALLHGVACCLGATEEDLDAFCLPSLETLATTVMTRPKRRPALEDLLGAAAMNAAASSQGAGEPNAAASLVGGSATQAIFRAARQQAAAFAAFTNTSMHIPNPQQQQQQQQMHNNNTSAAANQSAANSSLDEVVHSLTHDEFAAAIAAAVPAPPPPPLPPQVVAAANAAAAANTAAAAESLPYNPAASFEEENEDNSAAVFHTHLREAAEVDEAIFVVSSMQQLDYFQQPRSALSLDFARWRRRGAQRAHRAQPDCWYFSSLAFLLSRATRRELIAVEERDRDAMGRFRSGSSRMSSLVSWNTMPPPGGGGGHPPPTTAADPSAAPAASSNIMASVESPLWIPPLWIPPFVSLLSQAEMPPDNGAAAPPPAPPPTGAAPAAAGAAAGESQQDVVAAQQELMERALQMARDQGTFVSGAGDHNSPPWGVDIINNMASSAAPPPSHHPPAWVLPLQPPPPPPAADGPSAAVPPPSHPPGAWVLPLPTAGSGEVESLAQRLSRDLAAMPGFTNWTPAGMPPTVDGSVQPTMINGVPAFVGLGFIPASALGADGTLPQGGMVPIMMPSGNPDMAPSFAFAQAAAAIGTEGGDPRVLMEQIHQMQVEQQAEQLQQQVHEMQQQEIHELHQQHHLQSQQEILHLQTQHQQQTLHLQTQQQEQLQQQQQLHQHEQLHALQRLLDTNNPNNNAVPPPPAAQQQSTATPPEAPLEGEDVIEEEIDDEEEEEEEDNGAEEAAADARRVEQRRETREMLREMMLMMTSVEQHRAAMDEDEDEAWLNEEEEDNEELLQQQEQLQPTFQQLRQQAAARVPGQRGPTAATRHNFSIVVRRGEELVDDAMKAVAKASEEDLKRRELRVRFEGEPGVDEGGVRREFLELVGAKIFAAPHFEVLESSRRLWFSSSDNVNNVEDAAKGRSFAVFAGTLAGLSVGHGLTISSLRLPLVAYRGLLAAKPSSLAASATNSPASSSSSSSSSSSPSAESPPPPPPPPPPINNEDSKEEEEEEEEGDLLRMALIRQTLERTALPRLLAYLAEFDEDLSKGLEVLLRFKPARDLEATYVRAFVWEERELCEGGADLALKASNRRRYVRLVALQLLNRRLAFLGAFARGFWRTGAAVSTLETVLAEPRDLRDAIEGAGDLVKLDWNALKPQVRYDGWGAKAQDHPLIIAFWECLETLDVQDSRDLLKFITGSSAAPIGGLGQFKPPLVAPLRIQRNGGDSNHLPTTHVCFHTLLLPDYDPPSKLPKLLKRAMKECEGFGLL